MRIDSFLSYLKLYWISPNHSVFHSWWYDSSPSSPHTTPWKRGACHSVMTLVWFENYEIPKSKFQIFILYYMLVKFKDLTYFFKTSWYSEVPVRTWRWAGDSWWPAFISICIYCFKKREGITCEYLICFVYFWNGLKLRFGNSTPVFLLCLEMLWSKEIFFFQKPVNSLVTRSKHVKYTGFFILGELLLHWALPAQPVLSRYLLAYWLLWIKLLI